MNESSTLAKRIKSARLTLGVSQKQLGILAGIDEFVASARINQYERGVHSPDSMTATRLADVLNVPVSYLYEADDDLAELITEKVTKVDGITKTESMVAFKTLSKSDVAGMFELGN